MKIKFLLIAIVLIAINNKVQSQNADTTKTTLLNELVIKEQKNLGGVERMPEIKDNVIYSGKKSEVILLDKIAADLSINNTRQIFSKVPGINIWENDGSGIQTNISTRGLSANRSWEFNVRQNGYDITSEAFGYPETYYTPPTEALSKIEIVRGASSLQYGTQFGGLLNYQIKKGHATKKLSVEEQVTFGSYGLANFYSAIGGTIKKLNYYVFLHDRHANGWRQNSRYNTRTFFVSANYQFTKKLNVAFEYTNMDYSSQQPGGLTDNQFKTNAQQSSRARNWIGTPWNVAALTIKYDISPKVNLIIKTFASMSERNSVGNLNAINIKDSINPLTLAYNLRRVDRDFYQNIGTEARFSYKYKLFKQSHTLAGGVRAYVGNTQRKQRGTGNSGSDFDFSLTNNQYVTDLKFSTTNYAFFAENIFQITNKFKVVPGIRFENIYNKIEGTINSNASSIVPQTSNRNVLLAGIGSEYLVSSKTNIYANISQAYRPVTFSEFTPANATEVIDPNLKDANGYNADFGYRGTVKNFLNFDVGLFYLNYDNRIGTILQNGANFKTNIGQSVSQGMESFIEINPFKIWNENPKWGSISLFTSNSFIDAKYVSSKETDPTKSYNGKQVENAPRFINRMGLTYTLKTFTTTFLYSSSSEIYTDALNTELPNASSQIGKIEGYKVMDLSCAYVFMENCNIKTGVNNLTDEVYATRRAGGYPGPGLLPGNGRTFYVSFGVNF
ncbi:MAG: TonB-dependent receptor [Bacteroidota bacterium]